MLWLGVDFETTGLDVEKDRIIEIGAVLWHVERKVPLQMLSLLVDPDIPVTPFITSLTGISDEDVKVHGVSTIEALDQLHPLMDLADYIVAHNGASFDKPLWEAEYKRCGAHRGQDIKVPWIDTRTDVPYPEHIKSKSLNHLAYDHEFINPFPHRAVTDVLTMLKIASKYDPQQIINYKETPSLEIRAMVTYNDREKAKAKSYHWDGGRKFWVKNIKEFQLKKEIEDSDFKVTVLKGASNEENNQHV